MYFEDHLMIVAAMIMYTILIPTTVWMMFTY